MLFRAGLVACLWLSALVAAAAIDSRGILPIPPSLDPFYQPPTGVESAAPGSILRKRQIVALFFNFIPDPIDGCRQGCP